MATKPKTPKTPKPTTIASITHAGESPPDEHAPPTDKAGADPVVVVDFKDMPLFKRLELAQALPEVIADEVEQELDPGVECMHHFKGVDRRTMRIVAARGGFAQTAD